MSSIKNKIAAFEAHNEEVRKSSPARSSSEAAYRPSPPPSETEMAQHNNNEQPVSSAAASTTSMASQSRRLRLQQQQRPQQRQQAPSPEEGGLKEQRRARKQDQRQRLKETATTTKALPPATHKTRVRVEKPSSSSNQRRISSSNAKHRSSRPAPQSRPSSSSRRSEGGRYVNSMSHSMESSEGEGEHQRRTSSSRDRRTAQVARAQRNHRMRVAKSKSPEPVMMTESDSYFNKLLKDNGTHPHHHQDRTDDDATQTSVRQIAQQQQSRPSSSSKHHAHHPPTLTRASSSSFDTEGDGSHHQTRGRSSSSFLAHSRSQSSGLARNADANSRLDDDDRTYDYGDQDSQSSETYEKRKERERKAELEKQRTDSGYVQPGEAFINKEDVEYIGKQLESPIAKTAAGVVAAGTVGCIIMGPVGLLVGAAAVGLGVGIMQIPKEQRKHVQERATNAAHEAHVSVVGLSEKLSNSCAVACNESGVADQIPMDLKQCFTPPEAADEAAGASVVQQAEGADKGSGTKGGALGVMTKKPLNAGASDKKLISPSHGSFGNGSFGAGNKRRPAVLRHGRVTPLDQIYALQPAMQPRAWLDVMASAETTMDEKSEAMEEILILAKDKRHARFLLDEGILDSIMWILTDYVESPNPDDAAVDAHVKLAATCAVTLGKAHCAALHTGGDLLLMSMYERGTVPEERQLAQMLYEVPHHVLLAKAGAEDSFMLKHVSMPQAEELATKIASLAARRP